jgi:putative holliday junction resolvase
MMIEKGRILAVDPGEKNIGIAISDILEKLARPLKTIHHSNRSLDVAQIADIARENHVTLIIIGLPTGGNGEEIPQGRHSKKLAEVIREQCEIPVILWEENNSTKIARNSLIEMNVPVSKRSGHQDDLAAAVILQSFLDQRSQVGDNHAEQE